MIRDTPVVNRALIQFCIFYYSQEIYIIENLFNVFKTCVALFTVSQQKPHRPSIFGGLNPKKALQI